MNRSHLSIRRFVLLSAQAAALFATRMSQAQPPPGAVDAFQRTATGVERRLLDQHTAPASFSDHDAERLRRGEILVEQLSPAAQPTGAMLHHWRGTALVSGATVAGMERLLRDVRAYPQVFSPDVMAAHAEPLGPDRVQAMVRVRQRHVLTVVLDGTYDVSFTRNGDGEGTSTSRSTNIAEMDAPGTAHEHAITAAEEHGFLWQLNTYWTYRQCGDGLLVQLETVSLSRAIPVGLGWALRPYVTSVPRDSLQFTLRSAAQALRNQTTH